jgi:hypothetical protein
MVKTLESGVARYGLPGLLLGVALMWVWGPRAPEAAAQTGSGAAPAVHSTAARPADGARQTGARPLAGGDSNGTLALITNTAGSSQWLYLIDTKERAFAVYRIDSTNSKGVVKLEASRQYKWDLKLEHYNNQAPEPDAIKATVETLARSTQ